jgi:hypothetical protein
MNEECRCSETFWRGTPASGGVIDAILGMHQRLAEATGGWPWVPPTWSDMEGPAVK